MTLLLTLGCAFFQYLIVAPLQARVQALQYKTAIQSRESKTRSIQVTESSPSSNLAQFYRSFPEQESLTDAMSKLYNAATQQNLTLEQGEYRLLPERDSKLMRYDVTLPVKGGYLHIRKFLAQSLIEMPALALESVSFSRQKADESMVNAQLQFTLYLRQP